MTRFLAASVTVVLCLPAAWAADAPIGEGHWRLAQHIGSNENPVLLLKVEKKDGKLAANVVSDKGGWKAGDIKIDGATVTIPLSVSGLNYHFEGIVDPKDSKFIRGALFDDTRLFRVSLRAQDSDKLEPPAPGTRPSLPEPMQEAQKLNLAVNQLRMQITRAKDANEKGDLQSKMKAAQKEAEEKTPGLYREVVAKHADSPFAVDAATQLLRAAARIKPKAEEVTAWIKVVDADASKFGPRIARDAALQAGEILIGQKDVAALALPLGEKVVAALKDSDPLATQSRALKTLAAAQKAAGKNDAAIEARLAKVEKSLDDEYVKKVPPFKPEKFAGRKDKEANRVVVMELFTGAQCPPCVAADVGFDALEKAYDHKDLILIQYHMHIPGPDPLTNPSTIARWDYYRDKFPNGVRGTPTTVFNGKTDAGGGGGMANSEGKFKQYKEIIDGLLEHTTTLKIDGSAKLAGDKVTVDLNLDGISAPSDKLKLRIILLEESIKYVGGNGLRFHHHVVRNVQTPATLKDKSLKTSATIDLAEVKSGLTTYLDGYAATTPFPYPDRPMELKHLKVVALVQDEDSAEILNAVQLDVK